MRRFLKGDGGMLGGVLYHMRHIPEKAGCIHYLSNYFGHRAFFICFTRRRLTFWLRAGPSSPQFQLQL